jgi:hypothetical protein
MRLSLLMLGFLLGSAGIATRAEGEDYPWCAIYSKDGDTHCYFSTREQCLADVSGIGGFCQFRQEVIGPLTKISAAVRRKTKAREGRIDLTEREHEPDDECVHGWQCRGVACVIC